jgi:hypothetical protein
MARKIQEEIAFYENLQILLKESKRSFHKIIDKVGTNHGGIWGAFPMPPGDADRLKTWCDWVDEECMPNNIRLYKFILKNKKFMEGFPQPIFDFIVYHMEWHSAWKNWKKGSNPSYVFHAQENFPYTFDLEVEWTLARLRAGA